MNRGVVLSADLDSIIIFTADCKLVRIPNRLNVKVGQEITFESKAQKQRERSLYFKPLVAFAMAVVAVLSGLLIAHNVLASRTYAIISIDVNPSVQFSLNSDLTVTDVVALNDEARSLLTKDHYLGKDWKQASLFWLIHLENNGYDHFEDVLISAVVPDNDEVLIPDFNLVDAMDNYDFLSDVNIHFYYSHDLHVAQEARRNEVSVGHQMIINQYLLTDDTLSIDDLRDKPLGEMVRTMAQNGGMDQTETTAPPIDTPAQTRPGTSIDGHPTDTIPSQSGGPPETIPSQSGGPPETIPSQSGGPPETIPSQSGGPPENIPSNPKGGNSGQGNN